MTSIFRLLALAALLAAFAPSTASAQAASVEPGAAEEEVAGEEVTGEEVAAEDDAAENEEAGWVRRLDEGAARLAAAQRHVAEFEGDKSRGAARRYPRGDAKEKYLEELAAAKQELADAEEAMPELIEEARRAGVVPGVLDRYENPESSDADDDDDSDDS